MINKHIKARCSPSVVIREVQISHSELPPLIHIRMSIEVSHSWLKTNVWFFRLDHRQLESLYLTGLTGKATILTSDLRHSQCITISDRVAFKVSISPRWSCSLHIYILSPDTWISKSLNLGTSLRSSSGTSTKTSLWRKKEKNLKTIFPILTQYLVLFHF